MAKLKLIRLPGMLTIYRFPVDTSIKSLIPAATDMEFFSLTRTKDEISLILPSDNTIILPEQVKKESGWHYFRVDGTLDFALTGIVSKLTGPLADCGISVFVVSTFDTDYILIQHDKSLDAMKIWNQLENVQCSN